ncbi:VG15 protein [Yinghuangia aomiensis]
MTSPSPPSTEEAAGAYYVQQQRIGRRAAEQAQEAWRNLDPRSPAGSFTSAGGVGDVIVDTVASAQRAAAQGATSYIDAVVTAEGLTSDWTADLVTDSWMGRAADGRSLSTLLWQPVETTRVYLDGGMPAADALDRGLADLIRMVVSEVADAGRGATGAGIAANRRTTGYIRHLSPPSCARCIILAGREYAWNQGFRRHPRCDCVHIPATLSSLGGRTRDPQEYWDSLSRREQDRLVGAASARAIRDGASLTNVVNAQRTTSTVNVYGRRMRVSLDATTRRGWFYRSELRLAEQRGGRFHIRGRDDGLPSFRLRTPRLLPEEIYEIADDRADAIRLLRKYGYIR